MIENSELITYLARRGALYKDIDTSLSAISKELNTTKATINRKLERLKDLEIIDKVPTAKGTSIRIKENGLRELQTQYIQLKNIFSGSKIIKGKVKSGLGEGGYYVSIPQYKKQFKEKLRFLPFKGTLNVEVQEDIENLLAQKEKILIDGFKKDNRTFGAIAAYMVKINNTKAAIIVPERTSHDKRLIEIISPYMLRKKFNLKDLDEIELVIENGI